MQQINRVFLIATILAFTTYLAQAKVSVDEAAKLGNDEFTCYGAERAGTDSGVAEYTGQWFKTWPGLKSKYGYEPGPYADEKLLFSITAENFSEHETHLTEGQIGLLEKYPETFRMDVYPSHRDFKFADWVCDVVAKNAVEAEITDDGLGVTGTTGAPPFPFPKNGSEAIWNVINPHRPWTDKVILDTADVYENGTIAWGQAELKVLAPGQNPKPNKRGSYADPIAGYFFYRTILPTRSAGDIAVGYQPNNYKNDATQAWAYQPGLRRVRKAPEVGFDYPVPPAGLRTTDDDTGFNGSPERYNWKLVGKREIYVPYNNYRVNDPAVSYKELITPNSINPDYLRYEMHRVWVIEADVKEGFRHIYKRRRLYVDEDSWLTLMADAYDQQDQLWRVSMILFFYSQESGNFHRGVSLYHDLTSGAYEATYLVNESKLWWRLNTPMRKQEFSPEAAARAGQ